MAFRSWNRGLAAVAPSSGTTPFGVWLYNGQRWFPDPTFPGGSVCKGDTVLWAGKLDYWLVGENTTLVNGVSSENWPSLCRFDGVNFEWERLAVPKATLAEVPLTPQGQHEPGGINAGACLAWNNCWFFGTYGTVVHWDGETLSNASVGLGSSPWLQADYTAAVARTDAAGNTFAVAAAASTSGAWMTAGQTGTGQPVAEQPDGSAPPQLFASFGSTFSPLGFTPLTSPQAGDPYRTDLVAVDFNAAGDGWVAGNPRGSIPPKTTQPAPLQRISTGGAAVPCPDTPAAEFSASASGSSYLWSSISVFPAGDALAGGRSLAPGTGIQEPVLVDASCGSAPVITRFRVADPTAATPAAAPLIPADEGAGITSVAANAVNDAWAATGEGTIQTSETTVNQAPHVYHLTDGQTPLAAAGNDSESRPVTQLADQVHYLVSPPVVVPVKPAPKIKKEKGKTHYKTVHLPSPIYAITDSVSRSPSGAVTLTIAFKVRAKVRIGVEAFRNSQVVSTSGIRLFRAGTTGRLSLSLNPAKLPTRIAFLLPSGAKT